MSWVALVDNSHFMEKLEEPELFKVTQILSGAAHFTIWGAELSPHTWKLRAGAVTAEGEEFRWRRSRLPAHEKDSRSQT